jgi:hypothetical protein
MTAKRLAQRGGDAGRRRRDSVAAGGGGGSSEIRVNATPASDSTRIWPERKRARRGTHLGG